MDHYTHYVLCNKCLLSLIFVPDTTFIVKNHKIVPLYDYVHLQKGVRNNLLTNDLVIKGT